MDRPIFSEPAPAPASTQRRPSRVLVGGPQNRSDDSITSIDTPSTLREEHNSTAPVPPSPVDTSDMALLVPAIRIHRYDIGIRLLQLLVFFWLVAGLVFLLCITLCSFVSIGYVTFRSEGATFLVVCAFAFYSFFLFKLMRSLIRTFVRLSMSVWKEKFGAGSKDFILLRWVDGLSARFSKNSTLDPETIEMRTEYTKTAILFTLLLLFVGVPLITVASIYGYWAIISVLCALLTIGSATIITLVNLSSRFIRASRFFWTVWVNSKDYDKSIVRLRASYIASTGHDHGRNIIDVLLEKAIVMLLILMLSSFILSGFKVKIPVLVFSACLIVVLLLCRIRNVFKCYRTKIVNVGTPTDLSETPSTESIPSSSATLMRSLSTLETKDYYKGHTWHQVILVFFLRFVLLLFGFSCLIYLDMKEVRSTDGKKPIELSLSDATAQQLIWMTFGFYVATVLKDFFFFSPQLFPPLRPFVLAFFQIAQLIIAIIGDVWFTGFTFTAATLLAIYEMDYREARVFWKGGGLRFKNSKTQKRAMRNTFMILIMVASFALISIIVGMAVGSFNTPEVSGDLSGTLAPLQYIDLVKNRPFASAVCTMEFTIDKIDVIDLATMSAAAYQFNATAVLDVLHQNPRLKDWTLGRYSLDNSHTRPVNSFEPNKTVENVNITTGIRFAEFISPTNVSVVAIRGTYKLEDLFQDLYLWSTVALLQTSSYFGTLVNIWPIETVAMAVYLITTIAAYPSLVYYAEMEMIIRQILQYKMMPGNGQYSDDLAASMVMVTGHSLGGGLASIVASHLNINGVTFSAPGLGYSTKNYNLTQESIMKRTVNVFPMSDPVAAFDKQIGMVQNIKCDAGYPMQCHSIQRTVNTLASMCGIKSSQ